MSIFEGMILVLHEIGQDYASCSETHFPEVPQCSFIDLNGT